MDKIVLYLALYTYLKIGMLDKQIKRESKRMDFFTWFLVNPLNLIFVPIFLIILILLSLNKFDLSILTNTQNIAIILAIAIVSSLISFGNKLYNILQDNADMNIVKELETYSDKLIKESREQLEKKLAEEKRQFEKQLTEEKRQFEKQLTQEKQQRQENQRRYELQRAEDQARFEKLFEKLGGDVSQLKQENAFNKGKKNSK